MSQADEAARVGAPISGKTTRLNITTSSQRFNLSSLAGFCGMYVQVSFEPDTAGTASRAAIVFGDSTVTAAFAQDTVGSEDITITATNGKTVYNGTPISFIFPSTIPSGAPTDLAVIGSGDGTLVIERA